MLITLFFFTDYTLYAVLLQDCYNEIAEYAHYAVFFSLPTLTALFYFCAIKIKCLTTLTTVLYFSTIKMKSLTTLSTLFCLHWLYSLVCFTPLRWNENLWLLSLRCFTFTIIKIKSMTTHTTLFFFTDYTHYPVLFHYYWNEISDCAHYAVFLQWLHWLRCFDSLLFNWNLLLRSLCCFTSLLLKWNMGPHSLAVFLHWLHSLCCFTSLLLNGNLWLYSLRCVTVTTTKNKFVTLITTPFYFTTIKMKYLSTLTTLF